jgi:Arc/MetJ family transcription regulator
MYEAAEATKRTRVKKKTRTYHRALKLAREHCGRQLWQQQQQQPV